MPTYQYRCRYCHREMELFQRITAPPETRCPSCKKEGLERGIGGGQALFQFKGKGFYQTEYKAAEKPAEAPVPSECCPCGKKAKTDCSSKNSPER